MQPAQESSFNTMISVHVRGVDKVGRAFKQFAFATNVSRSGALLCGMEDEPRCGDVIAIRHKAITARFTVVWTRESKTHRKTMVVVHRFPADKCPWEEFVPIASSTLRTRFTSGRNASKEAFSSGVTICLPRRRWERHRLDVPVRVIVHKADKTTLADGRGNELSQGGMAVTAGLELRLDDVVEIEFTPPYSGAPIRQRGVVRNRAGYRYGIEFLIANREESENAEQLLTAVTHA